MTADGENRIDAAVDESMGAMVALRRHLHAHPEPSGEELRAACTSIAFSIAGLQLRVGPEGCGVLSRVAIPNAARRIRAAGRYRRAPHRGSETDALSRTVSAVMHACGMMHIRRRCSGALLALDRLECDHALPWPVTWRGIFHRRGMGEGAKAMIGAGALEDVARNYAATSIRRGPPARSACVPPAHGELR